MLNCFFVSDLHGRRSRYETLFKQISLERPQIVFLGGDLLPAFGRFSDEYHENFLQDFLFQGLKSIREELGKDYPKVFLIFGNDDIRTEEATAIELEQHGLWFYAHNRWFTFEEFSICGYAYVPPTPFRLKDWERYDVSRYVDPGCIAPAEGTHTTPVAESVLNYATIHQDLQILSEGKDLSKTIFLFHAPPHKTNLDRAALDGKKIDHVPLDVHVGSIAIRRFIEARQPLVTMHGHIHESARLTGSWRDRIGSTHLFSAAYDGPELALVRFNVNDLGGATRDIL